MNNKTKCSLAFSGGLDTVISVHYLVEKGYDVHTFYADVGQPDEDQDQLEAKAKSLGASSHTTAVLLDEFASNYIYPMLRGNACYHGYYPMTALARPLIGERQVKHAHDVGAKVVCHGATGKGNDQVRFEKAYAFADPNIDVLPIWRTAEFRSKFPGRREMLEYCQENNLNVKADLTKPYSCDSNIGHCSYEAGLLDDLNVNAFSGKIDGLFEWTQSGTEKPDPPVVVDLEFDKGDCIALDGRPLKPHEVIDALNQIGSARGVGRVDIVEDRVVGMKSRGCYESPGIVIYLTAKRSLEELTIDGKTRSLIARLMPEYACAIYNGDWFSTERTSLQALIDTAQQSVSGKVRVKVGAGTVVPVGRESSNSLYIPDLASMEGVTAMGYSHDDATGFIRLNSLRYRIQGELNKSQIINYA